MASPRLDDLVPVPQVAAELGFPLTAVRHQIKKGHLPVERNGRAVFVRRSLVRRDAEWARRIKSSA